MVEYALLLSLIALALVGTIGGMAGQIGGRFNAISNTLASGGNGGLGPGTTVPNGGGGGTVTPPPTTGTGNNNGNSGGNSGTGNNNGGNNNGSSTTPDTGDSKWDGVHDDLSLPAYAVYSFEDQSLEFFRDKGDMPNVGERSRTGNLVSAIYTDFEDDVYADKRPWLDQDIARNILRIRFVDRIRPRKISYWFATYTYNLKTADLSKLDVSNVSDMSKMFQNDDKLTTITGVEGWDTGRLIDMSGAFWGCSSLTEISGIEKWDVKNVRDVSYMFYNCQKLKADCSPWHIQDLSTLNKYKFNEGAPLVVQPSSWT